MTIRVPSDIATSRWLPLFCLALLATILLATTAQAQGLVGDDEAAEEQAVEARRVSEELEEILSIEDLDSRSVALRRFLTRRPSNSEAIAARNNLDQEFNRRHSLDSCRLSCDAQSDECLTRASDTGVKEARNCQERLLPRCDQFSWDCDPAAVDLECERDGKTRESRDAGRCELKDEACRRDCDARARFD